MAQRTSSWSETPDYLKNAKQYEFQGDIGDIDPPDPAVEATLFSKANRTQIGNFMSRYHDFIVDQVAEKQYFPISSFDAAGLHPLVVENVKKCGFNLPTPIQAYSVAPILDGQDLVATSQTGSGKTAAFLAPVISKLLSKKVRRADDRFNTRGEPLVLLIAPTRELALQIAQDCRRLCYRSKLRVMTLHGGTSKISQLKELRLGCDILIGTAGRLVDILTTATGDLSLKSLQYVILDEADEMMTPGWAEEMQTILSSGISQLDANVQFLMFSATFESSTRFLARTYMADNFVRLKVGRIGSTIKNITQTLVWSEQNDKLETLRGVLESYGPCRTLVFCNTRNTVDRVEDFLAKCGYPVCGSHSGLPQEHREEALKMFLSWEKGIFVATDVVGRGIDINNIMHIVNFDLPSEHDKPLCEYVNRIGRTGRLGNLGSATSLYNARDEHLAQKLTNLLLENEQKIPDFFELYIPEGGKIVYDDDESWEIPEDNEDNSNAEEAEIPAQDEGFAKSAAGKDIVGNLSADFAKTSIFASPKTAPAIVVGTEVSGNNVLKNVTNVSKSTTNTDWKTESDSWKPHQTLADNDWNSSSNSWQTGIAAHLLSGNW